jgi:hypothetical protein
MLELKLADRAEFSTGTMEKVLGNIEMRKGYATGRNWGPPGLIRIESDTTITRYNPDPAQYTVDYLEGYRVGFTQKVAEFVSGGNEHRYRIPRTPEDNIQLAVFKAGIQLHPYLQPEDFTHIIRTPEWQLKKEEFDKKDKAMWAAGANAKLRQLGIDNIDGGVLINPWILAGFRAGLMMRADSRFVSMDEKEELLFHRGKRFAGLAQRIRPIEDISLD